MRIFDILNRPRAVFLMFLLVVGVNGYLFYGELGFSRSPGEPEAASAPANDPAAGAGPAREVADVSETTKRAAPDLEEETEASAPTPAPPEEETEGSAQDETPVGLGDLRGVVRDCEGDTTECVRGAVEESVRGARYLGGREDLAGDRPGGDTQVLYFEVPGLEPCESVKQEYGAEDAAYSVILVGEGTFESEEGAECVPTA